MICSLHSSILRTEFYKRGNALRVASTVVSEAKSGEADIDLSSLLGAGYEERFDEFDLVQLKYVIKVCRESVSFADAGKKLFGVSRLEKKTSNDTDRLRKYLRRFGISGSVLMR